MGIRDSPSCGGYRKCWKESLQGSRLVNSGMRDRGEGVSLIVVVFEAGIGIGDFCVCGWVGDVF